MAEKTKEMEIIVLEGRQMTDLEVETIASLLFVWWRQELEKSMLEDSQEKASKEKS